MTERPAVRAMLEARTVAVVGASARPGSFGDRLVTEVTRSPSRPEIHLVNPRYAVVQDRPCVPSLDDVAEPVDLVLLGVGDDRLEETLRSAAARGDRSAVVFATAWGLGERLRAIATSAGMALCGGGCMGFLNPSYGVRALGYLERPSRPAGPVALVSHSGSAFSALLRSHRRFDFSLAVSSGQELVTTTADYLDYALELPETRVVALLLETIREPDRLRAALRRANERDLPIVLLAVGGTPPGGALVTAHSGALAGPDAAWEALTDAHGLLRVDDLDEMADLLELLVAGRRAARTGLASGIATVHDSGAERALVADTAHRLGVPFADVAPVTLKTLDALLDPGLTAENPLDVWGSGADTRSLFARCLSVFAEDPAVAAVALAVDLVPEFDGDDSYPLAALDAATATDKPVVVLGNMVSAIDQQWAGRLRAAGVPVLEGTRSGLRALGHLLAAAEPFPAPQAVPVDAERRRRWAERLSVGPLRADEGFALLRDYGIPTVDVEVTTSRDTAVAAARRLGYPVVLKTAEAVDHKWDVGGVRLGLADAAAVADAYDDLAARLGPRVVVSTTATGVELALGVLIDPLLGPMVVVGGGGVLVDVMADRAVGLPPLDDRAARRLVDRLALRPVLDGVRGGPAADVGAVRSAICALAQLAVELGEHVVALDVNPLMAGPAGAVAVDVLINPA